MTATTARVSRVDVVPVKVPRSGYFALQRGNSDAASWFAVVRIETEDGVVGWGECTTRVRSMHWILLDHLAELVVGRNPFDVIGIHAAMDVEEMLATERLSHWNPIRAAIDVALYDIQGKYLDMPISQLLGGAQRDSIETIKNVGVDSVEASAALAQKYVAAGYRAVKLRVGKDAALDLARVRAVRAAVGDDIRIRVDANQAWDPTSALAAIARMDEYGLHSVEQPCAFWDVRGNAEVVAGTTVPVISDEGFWTVHEAQVLLTSRAADVLHIYIGKCGGLLPSSRIIAVAEAFGASVTPGERVPLGIAEAAHVHLAATARTLDHPCALSYDLNEHDLLVTSLHRDGGRITVPDGPGLGVDIDVDKLAFYARDGWGLPWK